MKSTVEISCFFDGRVQFFTVPAVVRGPLALHKEVMGYKDGVLTLSTWNQWTVTHIYTGQSFSRMGVPLRCEDARTLLRRILDILPPDAPAWEIDNPELVRDIPEWRKVVVAARAFLEMRGMR